MRRPPALALVVLALLASPLHAQARGDQARLSFGLGIGSSTSSELWTVRDQPMYDNANIDTIIVSRSLRPTLGLVFLATWFPKPRFGLAAEAHLLGLGYEDHCRTTYASGSARNLAQCRNINIQTPPGTAAAVTLGGMFRPFPTAGVQPYLRGNVGLLVTQQSAVRMRGTTLVPDPETPDPTDSTLADYYVYQDEHPSAIRPTGAIGVGFTAFVGRSYQTRLELKDNMVLFEQVTRPATFPNEIPDTRNRLHHVVSLTIGFEVVLEKKRGRRY
jgi:hypothetical protein